jgi:hypothetical protein
MRPMVAPALMMLCLSSTCAGAATYYVRTGGSDSHSCEQAQTDSDSRAKHTPQAALDCLLPDTSGHTVIVHAGTYEGPTDVRSSSRGTSWSDLNTFKAADGEQVILTNRGGTVLSLSDHLAGGGTRPNQYWSIEGLTIDCQGSLGGGIVMDVAPYMRLKDVTVRACRVGIIGCGDYDEFLNLHVHHIGLTCPPEPDGRQTNCYGMYCGASHVLIDGGSWHDMGLYALHLYSGAYDNTDVTVNNLKVCRAQIGIGIFNHGHTVTNNVLAGNETAIFASPGNNISGNTIYGGSINIGGGETVGNNTVVASSSAGGDVCAYDGAGPSTPPAAGKLPKPRNFRLVTK